MIILSNYFIFYLFMNNNDEKLLQFCELWNNRYMEMIRLIPIVLNMYNEIPMDKKKEVLNKWVQIQDEPYAYTLKSDADGWRIDLKQTKIRNTEPKDLFMMYNEGYPLVDNIVNPNIVNPNGGGGRQKKSSKKSSKKKFRNIKKTIKYRH